jgi:hypothetical protein
MALEFDRDSDKFWEANAKIQADTSVRFRQSSTDVMWKNGREWLWRPFLDKYKDALHIAIVGAWPSESNFAGVDTVERRSEMSRNQTGQTRVTMFQTFPKLQKRGIPPWFWNYVEHAKNN